MTNFDIYVLNFIKYYNVEIFRLVKVKFYGLFNIYLTIYKYT